MSESISALRREVRITLETITPLFLAGADPRGEPELRPPAFRGAMRYWWRAAMGGTIGDNKDELQKLESQVFGNTDHGSPIAVRISSQSKPKFNSFSILPHKDKSASRNGIPNGFQFDLILSAAWGCDMCAWEAACASLQLALTFGGVGLRARRGHGTLKIIRSSDEKYIQPMPNQPPEWKKYITQTAQNSINAAKTIAEKNAPKTITPLREQGEFPHASKGSRIIFCKNLLKNSGVEVIKEFMNKMPLQSYLGGIKPRQASPLWMRPIQIDRQYGALLISLPSNFKGNNLQELNKTIEKFNGEDLKIEGWNR